jgi:threonine aldolase
MRQVGILAAAALYALDHHIDRLAEDHHNARVIAQAIADTPGLRLDPPEVETNLIWVEVDPDLGPAKAITAALAERGILLHTSGAHTFRATTHLDVSVAQALRAAEVIRAVVPQVAPAPTAS